MLSEPPDDLADRIVWRREAEETFADKVRRRLTQIVVGAYDAYLGTLTAAGDLSAFDSIPQQWQVYVLDELSDDLDEMYKAGAITAWNQAPTTTTLPTSAATGWAQIIAEDALQYQSQATNRLVGVGDDIWRQVNSQVTDALQKGASTEDLKRGIERITTFSEQRADTIARTEMNAAFVNGAYQGEVALGEHGPVWKEWLPVGDARTRPEHLAMEGVIVPFGDDFIVGDEPMAHPLADGASAGNVVNCLVEGSIVRPIGDLLAISRAWWDGPTVEIVTADGVGLHVTPNHPVLTSRGMVPAQTIHKGDEVITLRQAIDQPDDQHVMPTVEELYRACSEMPTKLVARVSGMNFHGDMPDQRVDVVWPDGSLRYWLEVVEHGEHGILVRLRDVETESTPSSGLLGAESSSDGEMVAETAPALVLGHHPSSTLPESLIGLPSDLATLVYRSIAKAEMVRLTARADRQTEATQAKHDRVPVHAESLGHRQHRLASLPSGPQVVLVDGDLVRRSVAATPSVSAGGDQSSLNGQTVRPCGSGYSGDGLASVVATAQVVEVKVHRSGHWVYNLTSSTGLLWSPAAVHSNCRCDTLFYYVGDTLPDGTLVEAPATMSQAVEMADEVAAAEEIPAGFRPGPNGERQLAEAFDTSGGPAARAAAANEVLEGIGRLHGLPNDGAAVTTVRFGGSSDRKGGHFATASRGVQPRRTRTMTAAEWSAKVREYNARPVAPEVLINKTGTIGDEMFSLAHETGHRVDWVGGSRFRTRQIWTENAEIRALMSKYQRDWLEHVDEINDPEVRAVASLGREVRSAESVDRYLKRSTIDYRQYFTSPEEVFARAYSQWITEQLDDPRMLATLREHQEKGFQFTDEEFDRIRPHILTILKERGLMTE